MNENHWEKTRNNLRTIGMKTFVKYYYYFKSNSLKEIINKFEKEEKWVYNSRNSKASTGKTIFRNENNKKALEIIISSNSSRYTIEKATEIYSKEFPNSKIKSIRFVRPEFVFGEDIINNLFSDYTILSQHKVKDYFIDWYIPELNLAIELDEKHHKKNIERDKIREKKIKNELNCKFVRYKI